MNRAKPAPRARGPNQAALDELIEQITLTAYGEDEQLCAFPQAFEDGVAAPCHARVFGDPVRWTLTAGIVQIRRGRGLAISHPGAADQLICQYLL